MGEADLHQQVRNLTVLLEVAREIGATVELDPLLRSIEQAALRVLDCERVTVFLSDAGRGELFSRLATGAGEIRFPVTRGIAGEAARTGRIVNVPDAYADARFNRDVDKSTGYRTRNLLAFPMTGYDGQVVGVLQVLNKRGEAFTAEDESLAAALSSLTGVAVQRQMLLEEYAEKQKLRRDLSIARDIQQSLLPKENPRVEGFDVAGWNKPADETGGDCYDFFDLPGGRLGLLLADATGHGIGPALVVSECRACLRSLAATTDDLGAVMSRTNELLYEDLGGGRFVTLFFGVLDARKGRIDYLSAGHGPLMVYRRSDGSCCTLPATTVPLGIMAGIDATAAEPVTLGPGDMFIVVTDGFFEWADAEGEQCGVERLFDVVRRNPGASAADLIRLMHEAVTEFGRGTAQADDLTAIIIRRL